VTDRAEAVVTRATLPTATTGRHDAFLSYSRKDRDAAAQLGAMLEDRGKDVWVDVEDIVGGADWRDRIKRGIEACRSFIFLLSPAALDSTHCREELELAANLSKQIIPVLVREVDARTIPPVVGDREWVFLRATDDFDGGLARLIEALETDLAWRDEHTRLAGRTREWLDADRDGSFLLRGADLRAAELWLADQTGHRESPTGEQSEYVLASRQAAVVRQRQLLVSVAAGLIIAVGLAIFAFLQRSEAISQKRAAQSRGLIAQSQSELGRDPSLAAVLSIEAHRAKPTLDARNAMLTLLVRLGRSRGPIASHYGRVNAAAFSPDAKTVATSGAEGAVRLWDVATRAPVGAMTAGSFEVLDVAWAHHGTMLASAGGDGSVRLWDARTQRQLAMLRGAGGPAVRTVAFSPDDKLLVSAGDDGEVRLWEVSARAARGSLPGDGEAVNDVAFERSGMTLAGAGTGGVRVWDVRDGRLRRSFASGRRPTYSVAFSRDGRILSAGGADGTVRLWDAVSGSSRGAVACRRGPVNSLAFDYRGRLACAGAGDGTVQLWDVRTRRPSGPALTGHEEAVKTVAFSPDGRTLVSASSDRTARVWDVAHDGSLSGVLRGHHAAATAVEFGSEDRTLASADHDGEIVLWDLPARRERLRLRGENRGVTNAIAVGPDELLASATQSGTVTLERGAAGRRTLLRGGDQVYALALRPGGQQLASGGADAAVRLWDVRGGRQPALLRGHREAVTSLRYAPDGRLLASASVDGSVRLWDAGRRRPLGELGRHPVAVFGVDFSPDGALLAAALRDGTVQLWDVARRRRSGPPLRGDEAALAVAFARDGSTLAVAEERDGRVQLWDVRERRRLGTTLENHAAGDVNALSFSRDGRLLASTASDGDIHLWDSLLWSKGAEDGEGRLERALCARVRRNLSVAEQRTFLPDGKYRETCPAG